MEILGIGPGEFVLILIVLLVVVGPERLPDLARQAGKLLVRGRNWLQSSPDAALVLRARQEIEQELAAIKSNLLELQTVRNEVLDAARQVEGSVGSLASARVDLDDVGNIAPPAASEVGASLDMLQEPPVDPLTPAPVEAIPVEAAPEAPPAPPAMPRIEPDPGSVARPRVPLDQAFASRPANGAAAPAPSEPQTTAAFESIDLRLQALMADLHALQQQLRQRGLLDADWQPPSWSMHMPGPSALPEGQTANDAIETEETS